MWYVDLDQDGQLDNEIARLFKHSKRTISYSLPNLTKIDEEKIQNCVDKYLPPDITDQVMALRPQSYINESNYGNIQSWFLLSPEAIDKSLYNLTPGELAVRGDIVNELTFKTGARENFVNDILMMEQRLGTFHCEDLNHLADIVNEKLDRILAMRIDMSVPFMLE